MPIYDYLCEKCDLEYSVEKKISEYTGLDKCLSCGNQGYRVFSCNVHFTGAKIEDAEFNVGLGKITKSKRHREELAKRVGAIEVGNEKPETIYKHFEGDRETRNRKRWESV